MLVIRYYMEVLWEGGFRSDGPVNFFSTCFDLHRVGYYFPRLISAFLSSLGDEGTPLALYVFLRAWRYFASASWAHPPYRALEIFLAVF